MSSYELILSALNKASRVLRGEKLSATDQARPASVVPSAGRLVDLTAFFLALELVGRSQDEEAPKLHQDGVALANKLQDEYVADVNQFILPVLDGWGLRAFKSKWLTISKPKANDPELYSKRAMLVLAVLGKLRTKTNVLHSIFADGRVYTSAKALADLVDTESGVEQMKLLSVVRPVGHMANTRSWMKHAFTTLGVDTPEFEEVVSDVALAQDLGTKLKHIDVAITNADADETVAKLQEERAIIVDNIQEIAAQSVNPQAVLSTAANIAADSKFNYKTEMGRSLMLSPEQEDAMMVRGKSIIASGAGSGKTRTMAGKVAYHVKELGARPAQFIATSFSNKSAHELIDRIKKYGGSQILEDGPSTEGFGTTHRVAGNIIRKYGSPALKGEKPLGTSAQTMLVRMAMEQVKMRPESPVRAPLPRTFFGEPKLQEEEGEEMVLPEVELSDLQKAAKQAAAIFSKRPPNFPDWKKKIVVDVINKIADGKLATPSPKQTPYANDGFAAAGLDFRISAAVVSAAKKQRESGPKTAESPYWRTPANKWFNLAVGDRGFIDSDGRAIGPKQVLLNITNWKANLITPESAFHKSNDVIAATYGAYEWLKNNTPEYANWRDHDDTLIKACQVMVSNDTALAQLRSRFKYILVDEAQDLNSAQHLMFGLIAGTYDPATQEPYPDGRMSADTYTLVGDDKQCIDVEAMVDTREGKKRAGDLKAGDQVISFRNGSNTCQILRHVVPSKWTWGYKVTTESGASLLMSPNHRLWASEPRTAQDQMIVYLMYRKDMGFRAGITNKAKAGDEENYMNSYGGRAFLEKAERLWVLEMASSREEALLIEQSISLRYGIPTTVFNGEHRGVTQDRIEAIFKEFGRNGFKCLEERHLSFDHPHWMSQSYSKHGRNRLVLSLLAHAGSNTQVIAEWSGDQFDQHKDLGFVHTKDDRRRLRRYFSNYRKALEFAQEAGSKLNAAVSHKLSTPEGPLREITASGLFVGMRVPVRDGDGVALEAITSIERTEGTFVDLDVDDASNFYANGILTHNSIYSFRGATPDQFINMSELVEGGQGFTTKLMETNYRSGRVIVDAANHLMSHNQKQIPMTCKAHEERKGLGVIVAKRVATHEDGAKLTAETVRDMCAGEGAPMSYKDFGVAARTNAELFAFGAEFLKLGIPFRSKINFFNNPTVNALLSWMRLANCADDDRNTINDVVLTSYRAPNFNLNRVFDEQLQERANGQNYLEYLNNGGWRNIYDGKQAWRNERYVKPYAEMLMAVKNTKGSPTEVLNFIMELRGPAIAAGKPGRSMLEDLVEETKKSPDATDLLVEETNAKVTDEDVRKLALAPIQPLLDLCAGYQDLGPCMSYIEKLNRANDDTHKDDDPEAADYAEPAVVLDTVHGWKGLEAKHIFVPMAAGVFPHKRSVGDPDAMAAERRLGYVAITRGQDNVTIICPEVNHVGKDAGPSQFVAEACIPLEGQQKEEEEETAAEPSEVKASMDESDELDAMIAILEAKYLA